MKRVRSASRSLDRSSSNIESYSASRSRSVSQLSQEIVSSQSIPSSLEVHVSRETVIYNGFCRAPDYYSKLLGPTVDESILVGLQMLINTGFLLPNCTEPPPKYELPSLESSSDVAAQTESSETKSGSSQTIEQISMSTPSDEVPIGISKEEKSIDYDESTESETPAPASVSSESLNILSSTITSEELIVEPSKVETEIIPESIEAEALFEEEEILEESEELTVENSESIYDLETLFEEKVVDDPVLEKSQEVVIPEKIIDIIPEKVEELLPEKLEEIILEKTEEQIVTPSIITDEKSSSEEEKISSKKPSKEDKSSSTYSILKSTTSSKSKESSTDSYVCSCHIQAGSEQQNVEKNRIRCVCPCSYCPRCDAKKKSKVIPCPFLTPSTKTEVPPDRSCQCANMVMMKNQNERNGRIDQDQKLLCDCYTSTSSTGYASSSESCNMQRGDCSHAAKCNVRYAITKITEYGKFTTFEVMKSTKKVPKFIPKSLEGVFVLKHKS